MVISELEAMGEDVLLRSRSTDNYQNLSTPPLGSNLPITHSNYDDDGYAACKQPETCGDVCECGSMYEISESIDDMNIDYHDIIKNILGMKSQSKATPSKVPQGHHHGAYMAKSQLYKVNEYSKKLYEMIPEGHNLEDWMRTKLAQISDDMSEVYHALKHDLFKGEI